MKKVLIVSALILLVAAACNKSNQTGNNPPPPPPVVVSPDTQVYSNATYGFEFNYPIYMKFVTPTYANLADQIVQIEILKDVYPNTNFGDAAFSVSAKSAKSLADCLKLTPPEGSDGFKTKVTINGTDFYITNSNGAGAGNFYEAKVYRTMKSTPGTCIELNQTIHTSNIGNYTPGTVTEVNKADVQSKLDAILNSFKFNQ